MKSKWKKTAIFFVLLLFLFVLSGVLMNFILPVKTSMISGDVGRYNNGDILFYSESESYTVSDFILYRPSSSQSTLVAEIVEINTDGTFKVIGTDPEPIDDLDQNSLHKRQIIGKVIASTSPYIFYPIILLINLFLAFILTSFISKKMKRKQGSS